MTAWEIGPGEVPVGLVFSHANGFNARAYLSILAPLAARTRVLAVDLRGHGGSTLPAEPNGRTSWSDIQHDLVSVLALADLRGVVLAGHSMGATVTLLAMPLVRERVRSAVLLEPVIMVEGSTGELKTSTPVQGALKRRSVFGSRAEALESYRGRATFHRWSEAMLADYVADGFRDRADGSVELAAAPAWEVSNYVHQAHDARAAFRDAGRPIRILKAERHSTCAIDAREGGALAGDAVRIETLLGTTHFLPMERPEAVAAVLEEALAEAPRSRSPGAP